MDNHIPDTKKKVEPMTLDELIDGIRGFDDTGESGYSTCQDIIAHIIKSRPALEASTRGVLRFRQVDVSPPYFVPVDMVGREIFHVRYATKERCKEIANDLGLTAEFEPAEPEEIDAIQTQNG